MEELEEIINEQQENIAHFLKCDCGFWDYLASSYYQLDNNVLYQLVMEMAYIIVNEKLNDKLLQALREYENWEV